MEEASRRKDKDPTPHWPEPERPLLHKTQREEEQGPSQLPPDPAPLLPKTQREEEQETSQPPPVPRNIKVELKQVIRLTPPSPWPESIQGEEDQGPDPMQAVAEEDQGLDLARDPMQAVAEEDQGPDLARDPMQWKEDQRGVEEQGSSQPAPAPSEQAKDQRFTESWITFPREDNPATWISDDHGEWRPRSASSLEPYYRDPDPEEEQGSSQPPAPSEQAKHHFFPGCSVKLLSCVTVSAFTPEPYYQDPDPEVPEYLDDMADFYLEAARRLPIAQMPNLAGFLSSCGLLVGLNEPVTNIIVNAMHRMATFGASNNVLPQGSDPARHAADRASYIAIARKSRAALVVFMTFYFRHLTQAQAKRYLRAARHDLALAVGLVELHRKGLDVHHLVSQGTVEKLHELFVDLHPDCARTKTALRYAATAARLLHDPDDLMRLVASRYDRQLLDPVLDDLRRGEHISVDRVKDILNLLRHPWSPPPPLPAPTPGTFRDADGNITVIANIGQDLFSTTIITIDKSNIKEKLVTTTTIWSGHGDHVEDGSRDTEHLTTDPDKKTRFHTFMCTTTAAQQLIPDMNSLKMCLLDNIHGFYIEALSMLPSDHQSRLLHAVLKAGYCFGVMDDPVHNIIVNSIWYSLHYPPPKDAETVQIHHTCSITRIASCSLDALIAIVSITRPEQEAVRFLNTINCRFPITPQLVVATRATKHHQPQDLAEFMELFPHRVSLTKLLSSQHALSNADFEKISKLIATNKAPESTTCILHQPASMDAADFWVKAYVGKKLEEVLFNYCSKYPLGPQYKLGIICGVASKVCSLYQRGIRCYHANFLASTGDVAGSILFFAEFWNKADDNFEQSKMPPICWPVTHRISYHCRCFICERSAVRIVHPFDVNYFIGNGVSTDSICDVAEREAALCGMQMESGNCL